MSEVPLHLAAGSWIHVGHSFCEDTVPSREQPECLCTPAIYTRDCAPRTLSFLVILLPAMSVCQLKLRGFELTCRGCRSQKCLASPFAMLLQIGPRPTAGFCKWRVLMN